MAENAIGSRKWFKVWVDPWLNGTTRFELTDTQRAFWMDLLAMAALSRWPGIIFAGMSGDRSIGYPIGKFQALVTSPMDVEETFRIMEQAEKIKVEITCENPRLYKVTILNWNKYQSEYSRQKTYRQKANKTQPKPAQLQPELQGRLQPELQAELQPQLQAGLHGGLQRRYGVEVEVEVEVEEKNKALVHQKPMDARADPHKLPGVLGLPTPTKTKRSKRETP